MLSRQNVIKAKCYQGKTLLGKLKQGKMLPRQNVTRQSVTRQNVTEPVEPVHKRGTSVTSKQRGKKLTRRQGDICKQNKSSNK